MKLKTRQRFLSLILTLCLLLSMTVQSVWATEEGGGTVTPQPASENTYGTLEFKDFSSVDVNTNTVTYASVVSASAVAFLEAVVLILLIITLVNSCL